MSHGSSNPMTECNHEEADTRIVVHLLHALSSDNVNTIEVRTVDTDVIVILVGMFHNICAHYPGLDLWVAFGMGRHFSFKHINGICRLLGKSKAQSLPVFHALTGCDTTSTFYGKSKLSAWNAWNIFPELTPALESLSKEPFQKLNIDSEIFSTIERFVIVMYDKACPHRCVNDARMALFCSSVKAIERLPPTQVNRMTLKQLKILI